MKEVTMAQILNQDVELTMLKAKGDTSHVETLMAAVNVVNLSKDGIKEYVDGYASAVIAQGMHKDSVKVLKSNRKCILEFAAGLRKGQEDKEIWNTENCLAMAMELGKEAGDVSGFAKACRQAVADEKPEPEWKLDEKLAKLIEKAREEGYSDKDIQAVFKQAMTPEPTMEAAA